MKQKIKMTIQKALMSKLKGKERYVTATFSKKIADQKMNDVNPLMPILQIETVETAIKALEKDYVSREEYDKEK